MGVEAAGSNKLYIRLPVKIKDELQIRDLHENIVQVYLPRQKSRRWCVISFENKQKQQEALVVLKKLKIDNKKIKISAYNPGKKNSKSKQVATSSTKPLLKLLKKRDYDDSDFEMNAADEWIMPPQEAAFIDDVGRAAIGLILAPDDETSSEDTDANWAISNDEDDESDEDYNPEDEEDDEEDDNYDFGYFYNSDEDVEEEIDYVTYPVPEEQATEQDKTTATNDTSNPGESSDTD